MAHLDRNYWYYDSRYVILSRETHMLQAWSIASKQRLSVTVCRVICVDREEESCRKVARIDFLPASATFIGINLRILRAWRYRLYGEH